MKALITGCSRGIGYGLVEEGLRLGFDVYAVARNTNSLKSLANKHSSSLKLIETDISQPGKIEALVQQVQEEGVDILINNAGIMLKNETADDFGQSFWVNTTIPFLLTKALLPTLKRSKKPRVAQITTLMASIKDNTSGGNYSYRASKTALNALTKSFAIDHPDVSFSLIHPGWVKTEMGGKDAPTEVIDSAQGIWKIIGFMSNSNSGQFVNFKGQALSW